MGDYFILILSDSDIGYWTINRQPASQPINLLIDND